MMAHSTGGTMSAATGPPPPPQASFDGGPAPPPSAAALGADLIDKQLGLSTKQVKSVAHLPLVAIDLHETQPHIALFPPKGEDPAAGDVLPVLVGKMKGNVVLKANESSHKTLRKWLTKSKGYSSLQADSLATANETSSVVVLEKPYRWLGLRRLNDAPTFLRDSVDSEQTNSHAIAEESSTEPGVTFGIGTLDGSQPAGDDFDRVVCKVRLSSAKKTLTVLPEEATQLLIHQAQYHVAHKHQQLQASTSESSDHDEETVLEYPVSIALPSWATHDAAVEALTDTVGVGNTVILARSVCALAGALLPHPEGKANPVLDRLQKVRTALHKEFSRLQVQDPTATFKDDMLVLLVGIASDGIEATAVQISNLQTSQMSCLFGDFDILSNVAYQTNNPVSKVASCLSELEANLDAIAPDSDGPAVILTYGFTGSQDVLKQKWDEIKSQQNEWSKVPLIATKSEAVALGAAVLGAVSHGRISVLVTKGKKTKADLALTVHNVAPVAVGVQLNYFGGSENDWTPVKTIFDFDRRVPAGPYPIDLKAAECVVQRETKNVESLSDEDYLKAIKDNEGAKGIPKREESALNLQVQIVQKWTRDGEWKKVGSPMEPLVKLDADENRVACESVALEISLGATGMIMTNLNGERESVVQATKSARNNAIRYYVGILLAILVFGGLLVKSYWEDHVFKRDTARLLAYYKHIIPGSIQDGDYDTARYLVWKYRGKSDKLWKNLEKKYGEPVLDTHEWPDTAVDDDARRPLNEEHETVELDEEDEKETKQEEPDL
jgi:hypothetical protein